MKGTRKRYSCQTSGAHFSLMLALLKRDPAKIMTTALTMYWMVSLFVTKPKKEEK